MRDFNRLTQVEGEVAKPVDEFGLAFRSLKCFWTGLVSGLKADQIARIMAGMVGLAGPLVAGVLLGQTRTFIFMSLGGLALSGSGQGDRLRDQLISLFCSLVAGSAAILAGSLLSGGDWSNIIYIPLIGAAAALFGGLSRPLARASVQFILYTVIAANIKVPAAHPLGLMFLFSLGAILTAGSFLFFQHLVSVFRPISRVNAIQKPRYPVKLYLGRWWRSLGRLSGWQYTLRIGLCLLAGQIFAWLWPHHHGYWVSVTVVIVVQRDLRAAYARAFHRAMGTTLGVFLTSLFLLDSFPLPATIAIIAILAGARPVLMEINYTAYAAVMTPLVILLLDFGQAASWGPVIDRLAATLVGCALALTLGYLLWPRQFDSPVTSQHPQKPEPVGRK